MNINKEIAAFEAWWHKRCVDRWRRYNDAEPMPEGFDHDSKISALEGWLARADEPAEASR
jgi:hypothetical protein